MGFGGKLIAFIVRGWTFLWTLLALALIGNAIAIQRFGNSSVNYAIFTAIICMIILLISIVHHAKGLGWLFMFALDAVATLFSLIAGIVLAARLHVHSCSNDHYLLTNGIAQGIERRCREVQASCAFFWFMFAGFAISSLLDLMDRSDSGIGFRGPRRGPVMSQV